MDNRLFTAPLELIREYGTNDPFILADSITKWNGKAIRIQVRYFDAKRQKGFCTNILNNYYIFINRNLSRQMQRMVCGHELGHVLFHQDMLSRDQDGKFRQIAEWEIFDMKDHSEYEANVFLAGLLIDTAQLKELICQGYDIVSIASILDVNVNLVALKVAAEARFDDVRIPFIPKQNFLGTIDDRADSFGEGR